MSSPCIGRTLLYFNTQLQYYYCWNICEMYLNWFKMNKMLWYLLSPLGNWSGPLFEHKDALCHVWIKFAHCFWNFFLKFSIISPWEREWPVIWTNLNSFHPNLLCTKFGWNWHGGSGEDLKSLQTDDGHQAIRISHIFSARVN